MRVFSDIKTYKSTSASIQTAITIGMFDGVHLGHKQLIKQLIKTAKENGCRSVVLTFHPHPRIVLGGETDTLRFITTLKEKIKLIEAQGVDDLILLPFNLELAALSAKDFIRSVLVEQLGMRHLVMGYNHRFGKDRLEDYSTYEQYAKEFGFGISKLSAVTLNVDEISSTIIRTTILEGNVKLAGDLLGHPFSIIGDVVAGQQLGRTIGFPTANVKPDDGHKIIPKVGVYACCVMIGDEQYRGMLNVGYRPTVAKGNKASSIEVHIFDFDEDIYSKEIEIIFIDRLRDEQKFNGVEELKMQLKADEQQVRKLL